MTTRRRLLSAVALAFAGCDKLGLGAPRPGFKAIDITGADYGRALALPDQDGRLRSLADFKGKVTVVFFGYTQCPDVCPGTMSELALVKKNFGPQGDKIQGVFVTIDPERDTPERLKAYVGAFDPSFVALRGTLEQTAAVAKDFKVYYAKVPAKGDSGYTMDHTAGSFIFDASGRLRLFTRFGSGPDALSADLRALLSGA